MRYAFPLRWPYETGERPAGVPTRASYLKAAANYASVFVDQDDLNAVDASVGTIAEHARLHLIVVVRGRDFDRAKAAARALHTYGPLSFQQCHTDSNLTGSEWDCGDLARAVAYNKRACELHGSNQRLLRELA